MTDDTYIVFTPYGIVRATFPEDAGIAMEGHEDAIAAVRRAILASIDERGMTTTPEALDPDRFVQWCQGPDSSITILPPAMDGMEPEPLPHPEEADMQADDTLALDSVGMTAEQIKRCRQSYGDYFHKIAATVSFKTWAGIWAKALAAPVSEGSAVHIHDGVEELSGLRAAIAAATNPLERIALVKAMKAAQAAWAADDDPWWHSRFDADGVRAIAEGMGFKATTYGLFGKGAGGHVEVWKSGMAESVKVAVEEDRDAQGRKAQNYRVVGGDFSSFDLRAVLAHLEPAAAVQPESQGPYPYRYALVNRPADMGTIPKGVQYTVEPRPAKGQPHYDMARHGILVTERELTAEELKAFELAPLVDGKDLGTLAEAIARGMGEYAAGYLEMAKDDPEHFAGEVRDALKRASSGITYSVGDDGLLVKMVSDKLAAMIPADPKPDDQMALDTKFLTEVADGKHPAMLEPELADDIEAAILRHPDDKALQDLGERAILAYSNGLMAAT